MKKRLEQYIDTHAEEIIAMADYIFDNPEIGLQEYKATKCICSFLQAHGFLVEEHIYGFETAFRAIYRSGSGGIRIGLLCEYDALKDIGHACGHHMQAPSILAAACAIKDILQENNFTLIIYGTPAEETIGAKVRMSERGAFEDIDVALMMHGAPATTTDNKSMALSNFDVIFHGTAAHAALAPDQGRSALDALLLFFHGIEYLREHVKEDTRMHYTITEACGPANVVHKTAKGAISLRSYDRKYLDTVVDRMRNIAAGASLMTDTSYEVIQTKSLDSKIPVITLNSLLMENAAYAGAPRIRPPREKTGSTDFGNVMYRVPGSCIRIAFVPEGTSSHSDVYLTYGKSEQAHHAIITAAKILAYTAYDLISKKELFDAIQAEFIEKKKH